MDLLHNARSEDCSVVASFGFALFCDYVYSYVSYLVKKM